jgi:hypothetical protein
MNMMMMMYLFPVFSCWIKISHLIWGFRRPHELGAKVAYYFGAVVDDPFPRTFRQPNQYSQCDGCTRQLTVMLLASLTSRLLVSKSMPVKCKRRLQWSYFRQGLLIVSRVVPSSGRVRLRVGIYWNSVQYQQVSKSLSVWLPYTLHFWRQGYVCC